MRGQRKEVSINILYEDDDILVCIKPAGVATQTRRIGQQDMVSMLRNDLARRGMAPYVGLVHRLDQPVEGILVFGKHPKSTAGLSGQLAKGAFSKVYLAVTEGEMAQGEGELVDYIKKDAQTNLSSIVSPEESGAKRAVLRYQVLRSMPRKFSNQTEPNEQALPPQTSICNLVRVQLQTGRHHQIRAQLAHLGNPIAGDAKYGSSQSERAIGLCACELQFRHPATGKELKFCIEPTGEQFCLFHNTDKG